MKTIINNIGFLSKFLNITKSHRYNFNSLLTQLYSVPVQNPPSSVRRYSRSSATPWYLRILLALNLILYSLVVQAEFHECSPNSFVGNDLIGLNAFARSGAIVVEAYVREPFGGIVMPGTEKQFDFYIDADQNLNTGDARPGTIKGVDYRVGCHVLINEFPICYLYSSPVNIGGAEQRITELQSTISMNGLQVIIPIQSSAVDVIAFSHGGINFYGDKLGNGDRCPEAGVFDTASGGLVVRQPSAVINQSIADASGADLLGWKFQTYGDQFRIQIDYQYWVDPLSFDFSGRIEMDTDRDLATGLVQTPVPIPSPSFNEIASWGWDVAIHYFGGTGTASDPTPVYLDFGVQSKYIIPPEHTYASPLRFPFGEGYNDGRWYITENKVFFEGSLSLLDARRWQILPDIGLLVNRITTDGKIIARLFTIDSAEANVGDMVPKNYQAFDTGAGKNVAAIEWQPDRLVSGESATGDHSPQFDIKRVEAQISNGNLIVSGTLVRLESNWPATWYIVFLETDPNISTGVPVNNPESNSETILADYIIWIKPVDLGGYLGWTTRIVKPDALEEPDPEEGRDSGLSMRFSDPSVVESSAKVVMTIPLSTIGNPSDRIRVYFASYDPRINFINEVAPLAPLTLYINTEDSTIRCSTNFVTVSDIQYSSDTTEKSEVSITTDGYVIIPEGTSVDYNAPVISLKPGFHAELGSLFSSIAMPIDCTQAM